MSPSRSRADRLENKVLIGRRRVTLLTGLPGFWHGVCLPFWGNAQVIEALAEGG